MYVEVLTGPWERARGATFCSPLEDRILAFAYPRPVRHVFHTFFCPPLRITALDEAGESVFSEVVTSGKFVRLPPARVVLESDPDVTVDQALEAVQQQCPEILTTPPTGSANGSTDSDIKELFFVALTEPLRELRSFKDKLLENDDGDEQRLLQSMPLWQQGRLLESAAVVAEYPDIPGANVPRRSFSLAKRICLLTPSGRRKEVAAAGLAGGPWPKELRHPRCIKCLRRCTWREVLFPTDNVPADMRWRYKRPENAVPLCRHCLDDVDWGDSNCRECIALGLWGARFGALLQWHSAAVTGTLPTDDVWSRIEYPLWPKQFGGETWATGSGAWCHVDMRSPAHGKRQHIHGMLLEDILGLSRYRIKSLGECFEEDFEIGDGDQESASVTRQAPHSVIPFDEARKARQVQEAM